LNRKRINQATARRADAGGQGDGQALHRLQLKADRSQSGQAEEGEGGGQGAEGQQAEEPVRRGLVVGVVGRIMSGRLVTAHLVAGGVMAADIMVATQAGKKGQELANDQGAADRGTNHVHRFHEETSGC
jgi:hypothetical protein